MAPAAQDEICALSAQATQLGNRISLHMLDYLGTAHESKDRIRELSQTFLNACRSMWMMETGLRESSATNRPLPEEFLHDVKKKFVTAYQEFQHLDKLVTKLIQYELKGMFGKLQRGWHRLDDELARINMSLIRITETLQDGIMTFHQSLRESKIEDSMGIGYMGLSAAVGRMAQGQSVMDVNKSLTGSPSGKSSMIPEKQLPVTSVHSLPIGPPPSYPIPPVPQEDSPRGRDAKELHSSSLGKPRGATTGTVRDTVSSKLRFLDELSLSTHECRPVKGHPKVHNGQIDHSPFSNSAIPRGKLLMERGMNNKSLTTKSSAVPEAIPMPYRKPSHTSPASAIHLHSALASAVQARNHKLMEELLDSGASPDMGENIHPLIEAAYQRDFEGMRLLLLFHADPNAPDKKGKTALLLSVEESFLDGATLLLKYGADPNFTARIELESPLGRAVANVNPRLVYLLLAHGGNPDHEMSDGSTLLMELIEKRAPKRLIDLLLNVGANPNRKGKEGKTPLFEAVQSDLVAVVSTLLDYGANPNLPGPEHVLWSAIHRPACLRVLLGRGADISKTPGIMEQATSINNIDVVQILLQEGVDPNSKKDGIYTPLCSSIRDDRRDIFSLLLRNGANPNEMASEYPAWKCVTHFRQHLLPDLVVAGADLHQPPGIVEMAVQINNPEALNWLLKHGRANPNDRNVQGHTALTTAIRDGRREMVSFLLANGADPNQRGQDWPVCMAVQSPPILQLLLPVVTDLSIHKGVMEMAVLANQLESIKLLLEAGASVEYKNGGVFSPLTTALREGHNDIVRFLLNQGGADPNAPGEHLPLVKAVRRCQDCDFSMIELLLEKGADPNKVYRDWNAIMQAIENRDMRLLSLLVKKGGGVDLSQQDDTGKTVLEMAEASGWAEVNQFLLENARK